MDASLDSAFHPGPVPSLISQTTNFTSTGQEIGQREKLFASGIIQAEIIKRWQRQTDRVQESGQGNEETGEYWFSRRMLR